MNSRTSSQRLAALALALLAPLGAAACDAAAGHSGEDAADGRSAAPAARAAASEDAAPAGHDAPEPARRAEAPKASAAETRPLAPEVLDTGIDLSALSVEVPAAAAALEEPAPASPAVPAAPSVGSPAGEVAAGGKISADEGGQLRDFGDLVQGAIVEHTFQLTTSGDGDLTVEQIKTSCGCTVAETTLVSEEGAAPYQLGTALPPGSKLRVKARLDTTHKQGRVQSVVTVMSTDPRGQLQLRLMANVTPFLTVEPRSLNFGNVKPNQRYEGELTITSPMAGRFGLTLRAELIQQIEALHVDLRPVEPDEDGRAATWKAQVALGPGIPEGPRQTYQLLFKSDIPIENAAPLPNGDAAVHEIQAFVVGSVQGLVSASPAYMSFGLMQAGQEMTLTVRIESIDEEHALDPGQVRLEGFQGPFEHADAAETSLATVVEGKVYDVSMTMRAPTSMTGTFRGKLVVPVGHPTKPEIEVPFTGVVRPAAPVTGAGGSQGGGGGR